MPTWLKGLLPPLIVTVLAFITYFWRYWEPPYFFWDENYHVAHAQKYQNGIYFMEPHPPLGKLLIAAGELIVNSNLKDDQFINTDYAKNLPPNFSFAGYRLFPALLSWLAAPLLYFILVLVTNNRLWGMLLSFLYIFDNALIVHSRGAMLEGPQLFFVSLALLFYFMIVKRRPGLSLNALVLGLAIGAAVSVKLNAAVLLLLFPSLAWQLRDDFVSILRVNFNAALGFCLIFFGCWYIHFWVGKSVNPSLPDKGYYQASAEYKEILLAGQTGSIANFPKMLRDSLKFVGHYEKGVPKLNLCNTSENGSPPWLWPIGARAISYRWQKDGPLTQHLYLQVNPAVWWSVLAAVLIALSFVGAAFLGPMKPYGIDSLAPIATFSALYVSYMAVMLYLDRVMYLYHYFLPLLFGIVLFGLVIRAVTRLGAVSLTDNSKGVFLSLLAALVVGTFGYFSPLTYYSPLLDSTLARMAWLDIWDLHCPACPNTNHLARSTCDPKQKLASNIEISGLHADSAYQDWGEPRMNVSVDQQDIIIAGVKYTQAIGVHAVSKLRFKTKKNYQELSGAVGLPDYLKGKAGVPAKAVFEILGDGAVLWSSSALEAGNAPQSFTVTLNNVESLELSVKDGENGIDNDHACWLNMSLR